MIIKDEMVKNAPDHLARQLLLFQTFLFRRCPTLPSQGLKSVISLFAGNKKARQAAVSPNNTHSPHSSQQSSSHSTAHSSQQTLHFLNRQQ